MDIKIIDENNSSDYKFNDISENKILKWTNRGRKEIISLPEDITKCDICLKYSIYPKEELAQCCLCKCLFHKSCYNQYIQTMQNHTEKAFKCIRCIQSLQCGDKIQNCKCFICGYANKTLNYDKMNNIYYHQICLIFLNEIKEFHSYKNIQKQIKKWRFKHACKYCRSKLSKVSAVIKCKKPKCNFFYHIPCAIRKGLIFDINFMKKYYHTEQIPFYCSNHNNKIKMEYKRKILDNLSSEKKETDSKDICEKSLDASFDFTNNVFNLDFERIIKEIKIHEEKETFIY